MKRRAWILIDESLQFVYDSEGSIDGELSTLPTRRKLLRDVQSNFSSLLVFLKDPAERGGPGVGTLRRGHGGRPEARLLKVLLPPGQTRQRLLLRAYRED